MSVEVTEMRQFNSKDIHIRGYNYGHSEIKPNQTEFQSISSKEIELNGTGAINPWRNGFRYAVGC